MSSLLPKHIEVHVCVPGFRVIQGLSCVIGPIGRHRPAATLLQRCPQITEKPGRCMWCSTCPLNLILCPTLVAGRFSNRYCDFNHRKCDVGLVTSLSSVVTIFFFLLIHHQDVTHCWEINISASRCYS